MARLASICCTASRSSGRARGASHQRALLELPSAPGVRWHGLLAHRRQGAFGRTAASSSSAVVPGRRRARHRALERVLAALRRAVSSLIARSRAARSPSAARRRWLVCSASCVQVKARPATGARRTAPRCFLRLAASARRRRWTRSSARISRLLDSSSGSPAPGLLSRFSISWARAAGRPAASRAHRSSPRTG